MQANTCIDHRTRVGADRRLRTRRKLLQTAFQLFAEQGLDVPIIDLVIRQAGLSRGTFYNHFRCERELFLAVAAEVSNEIVSSVDSQVLLHDNAAVRVACGVTLCVQLAQRYPLVAAFLVKGGAQAVFAGGGATNAIARDVQMGLKAGLFTLSDPALAIDLVLGPVLCTFGSLLQRPLSDAYVAELVGAILRSLGIGSEEAARVAALSFGQPQPHEDALFIGH